MLGLGLIYNPNFLDAGPICIRVWTHTTIPTTGAQIHLCSAISKNLDLEKTTRQFVEAAPTDQNNSP